MAITPPVTKMNLANRFLLTCAIQCITELTTKLPRTLATETYMCTDQQLGDSLELCVSRTCTIKDAVSTKCITESICNRPLRNRTNVVSITAIVGVSLALLAVMLRFLSRMKSRKPGMDDWTMIIAMGFVIPLSAMAIILANHGLGKDIWSVPFENITHVLYVSLDQIREHIGRALLHLTFARKQVSQEALSLMYRGLEEDSDFDGPYIPIFGFEIKINLYKLDRRSSDRELQHRAEAEWSERE
ncbi:hypothetical protein BKA61DRAFT_706069 [Leptodontidium sp. MPI-SDFR-AT-0119]|nr:hypothetical protein BKA61DRAFT_706069 [Leptodontidium sp. MPI-SDFR-AT-0119]